MTEQEQRIAIAEACGWTHVRPSGIYIVGCVPAHYPSANLKNSRCDNIIPDYPNDLNAMHEAEKILVERGPYSNEWRIMESMLARIIPNHIPLFHATAQQRAEAFLRTIGKWKD